MKASETLIYINTATNQSINISYNSNLIPAKFSEEVDSNFYTDKNSRKPSPATLRIFLLFHTKKEWEK